LVRNSSAASMGTTVPTLSFTDTVKVGVSAQHLAQVSASR